MGTIGDGSALGVRWLGRERRSGGILLSINRGRRVLEKYVESERSLADSCPKAIS